MCNITEYLSKLQNNVLKRHEDLHELSTELNSIRAKFETEMHYLKSCENEEELRLMHEKTKSLDNEIYRLKEKVTSYIDADLTANNILLSITSEHISKIEKIYENENYNYYKKSRNINNLLAVCFGLILFINIFLPKLDVIFFVMIGLVIFLLLYILMQKRSSKTKYNNNISDLENIRHELDEIIAFNKEINAELTVIKDGLTSLTDRSSIW